MIHFGTFSEKKKLDALLATHHRVDVVVMLMDLSHKHLSEHSDLLLSGQVNIDVTADVTRSASVDLRDPLHRLKLDDAAPSDGSLFFTKMIRIVFVISTPDLSERYPVPLFTGPINRVSRNGPVITVEAQGKEVLSFATLWAAKTFKKGMAKTDVIQKIMQLAGETKFQFTDKDAKIGQNLSANRKNIFWKLSRKIASGLNLQLFYDGRGILRLRHVPQKSVYEFQDTNVMISSPQVSYEENDEFYNAVEVIGGKPKGKKKKVHLKLVAPHNHPLSPWNLGRNGTPRYVPLVIEDDSIKSVKAARTLAKRQLNNALTQPVEVSFDSLPVPYLEENDLCRYSTPISSGRFRLKQMSIPLTVDGTSSIGYLKNTTPKYKGGRRRRHHK